MMNTETYGEIPNCIQQETAGNVSKKGAQQSTPLTGKDKIVIALLCASQLVATMSDAILSVFFPQAAYKKRMNPSEIGYVFSAFYFGTLFFSPLIGFLITRIGTKEVIKITLSVGIVVLLIFPFTDYVNSAKAFMACCLLLRVVQGFSMVGIQVSTFTIVAHQFEDRVATLTGMLEMCNGIGYSLSAGIGGALYEYGGYSAPFFALFGITLIVTALCWLYIPSSDAHLEFRLPITESFHQLLKHPAMYFAVVPTVLLFLQISFITTFDSAFLLKIYHITPSQTGLLISINAVVCTTTSSLVGLLIDKLGLIRTILTIGFITRGSGLFLFAPDVLFGIKPVISLGIVGQIVIAVGYVAAYVPLYKYLQIQTRNSGFENNFHTSTMVATLLTTSQALGSIVGPLLGGHIIEKLGYDYSFNVFGILITVTVGALTLFIVYIQLWPKVLRHLCVTYFL